ncbi:MAG: tetratricopeptide repeat protein, partial [Candidatus Glassbacteria bacterium]
GGPGSVAAGALSVFWTYLGNFLLPTGLSVRYLVKVPLNFFNPATLLYAAGLLAILAAVAVAWRRGRRLPAFAGAWAVLAFAPSSGVVPLEILRADRYTLTMLPAFAIAVAYLLREFAGGAGASREKRLRTAVCAVPLVFAVLFVSRLAVWRNSETLWADVLNKRPDHYIALNGMAKVRLDQGDTTSAITYYNRALEANPHSVLSLQSLGILYDKAGDHREAEDCLLKAVSEPADRAQSRMMLAEFYLRRARLTEARAALEKLVAEDPDDPHLNYLLSTCYQRLGLLDLAETCLRRARAYDPGNPVYLTGLGRLQVQKGDLEYAVDLLGLSLAADQDYVPTYVGLGEMFLAAGKLADSRNSFTAALTREPDNVEALRGMAGVYGRAGRLDSAAVLIDRLLALDPRDCRAQANLVALKLSAGEPAAAAGLLDKAIGCDSTIIENYLNGCRIYLALDSLARAEEMVRTAYRFAPSNPAVQAAVSDFRGRTSRK